MSELPLGRRSLQIGPTLFFSFDEPKIGAVFSNAAGRWEVVGITPSPEDGGYLFTVEPK